MHPKNSNLDHVVKGLLIAQTEAFPDVKHVDFGPGHHDPDQGVISCAQTLEGYTDNTMQVYHYCVQV